MSVQCIPHETPLLYSKTGVWRGIPIFLIFAPKHRLWVLHNLCFEQKQEKYQKFSAKNVQFLQLQKNQYISWACFRNDEMHHFTEVYATPDMIAHANQRTNGPVNAHLSLLLIPINMFEYYGI